MDRFHICTPQVELMPTVQYNCKLCSVKSRSDSDKLYQGSDIMKKKLYSVVPISLLIVGIILSCSLPTVTVQWPKTETPTPDPPTSSPTLTVTETLAPTLTSTPTLISVTDTVVPPPILIPAIDTPVLAPLTSVPTLAASSTPQMAPFCEEAEAANQSACGYPIARQSGAFCVKKSPYNLIALNDGSTYQLLHDHVQCEEAGVQDGQRNVICTGPMAYYFELKVCDSACASLRIEPDLDRCPFGYAYNNLQKCCTNEIQEVAQGCTVLKLRTISCETDCGQFTSKSTCTDYGYACRWNDEKNSCQMRK